MAASYALICERCHAGQMLEYERRVGRESEVTIRGTRCERCGYVQLANDDDIWSAV